MKTIRDMTVLFLSLFRFVRLLRGPHQAIAIENAALRMQLAAFKRKRKRPLLTTLDRVFWITLRSLWPDWRHPLIYVQADTVVHWHREWRLVKIGNVFVSKRLRVPSEIREMI